MAAMFYRPFPTTLEATTMMSGEKFGLCVTCAVALAAAGCLSRQGRIDAHLSQIVWTADLMHAGLGKFPESWEELKVLDDRGELAMGFAEPARDPWRNPYIYQIINDRPVAICYGKDAKPGGDGDDRDAGWTLEEPGATGRGEPFARGKIVPFEFE